MKNFVDLQRTDGDMQFRFAIPFPRKVFSEEGTQLSYICISIPLVCLAVYNRTVGGLEPWEFLKLRLTMLANFFGQAESFYSRGYFFIVTIMFEFHMGS